VVRETQETKVALETSKDNKVEIKKVKRMALETSNKILRMGLEINNKVLRVAKKVSNRTLAAHQALKVGQGVT
jgi:hypothetical protein